MCVVMNKKKWREVVDLSSLEQYMSTVLGETVKAENISFNQIDKLFKYRLSASKLIEMIINLDTMGITSFL